LLFSGLMIIGVFYFPDFLCAVISKKHQRIADLAAGTAVILSRTKNSIQQTIYLELEDREAQAMFPQVMRLTDKDINGIRNLLARTSRKKSDLSYVASISGRIRQVLDISSELEDTAFLEQLMQDYNLLTQKK
jgi:hypothetical protein